MQVKGWGPVGSEVAGTVLGERCVHRVPAGEGIGMPSTLLQGVRCV